jgi:hypothetical protein
MLEVFCIAEYASMSDTAGSPTKITLECAEVAHYDRARGENPADISAQTLALSAILQVLVLRDGTSGPPGPGDETFWRFIVC